MNRRFAWALLACWTALPCLSQTPIRKPWTAMTAAKLATIPTFELPAIYKDRVKYPLPTAHDNTKQKFFPPYEWNQQGYSCASAQAVGYSYTYAAQMLRNKASSGATPEYSYEYTYHFLNGGDQSEGGDGWNFVEAFDILKETGAPTSTDFGGFEWGNRFGGWMSGYDKYYNAMKLRLKEYYRIDASVPAGDEPIKQYLIDQGDQSPVGGILVFHARSEGWTTGTVGGREVISAFEKGGGHALGIVGYDDKFNGGSWMVVNSWGDGFYWVQYKLMRAGGNLALPATGQPVMFCKMRKDYTPQVTFKIKLTHSIRNNIAILTGVAGSASATAPTRTKDYAGAFNYSGGAFPMVGKGMTGTIEIGLDLTDLSPDITGNEGRFFLQVVSKGGVGQINSVSLMDYTGAQVKEISAAEVNKVIAANGTTTISIPWTKAASSIGPIRLPHNPSHSRIMLDRNGTNHPMTISNLAGRRLSGHSRSAAGFYIAPAVAR